MPRKAIIKPTPKSAVPNLPQHDLPEPYRSLQAVGYDEDVDLYITIEELTDVVDAAEVVDKLTAIALDANYYAYGDPNSGEDADPRCFAPMQAIRALCYIPDDALRVFDRLVPLFDSTDSALREELPLLFACMGPGALEPLTAITVDAGADINLRDGAAESLVEMVEAFPEVLPRVTDVLERAMSECDDAELTAYFILGLLDIGATESIPLIEHTFHESRVDLEIVDLDYVREHFELMMEEDEADLDHADLPAQLEYDSGVEADEVREPYVAPERPGRNDPCPCGSGKKFKKCHGSA